MPLKRGKERVAENIREMHHGERYEKVLRKYGKARADKMAVAAAFGAARRRKKRGKS